MLWWTLHQLKSKNPYKRRAAAIKLGEYKQARAVEPLIDALKDADDGVRRAAAESLGKLGDARAVEPLINLLKNDNFTSHSVALALGRIGDKRAIEPLLEAIRRGKVEGGGIEALTLLGWEPADDSQRALVAITLRKWDEAVNLGEASVEWLLEILSGSNMFIWEAAAETLGRIAPEHKSPDRLNSLIAKFIQRLVMGPGHEENAVSRTLEKLDPNWVKSDGARATVPMLIEALNNKDWSIRYKAEKTLGAIGDKRAAGPLADYLSKGVSETAIDILGEIGDKRSVKPLLKVAYEDEIWSERAISALAGVLKREPEFIYEEDLMAIATLGKITKRDMKQVSRNVAYESYREVDCTEVREIAKKELIRRNLLPGSPT
jgi:HEAT repeat protein